MKAEEVLRRYADGQRDFTGENLRGQSLKGKELSGADFSKADIRGANFTNATLEGVKFIGAKAGLQRRWAVSLVLVSWLLAAIAGLFAIFMSAIVLALIGHDSIEYVISGWISLVTLVIFSVVTIRKGTLAGFGFLAVAVAVAGVVAGAGAVALAGSVAVAGVVALAGSVAVALAEAGAGAGAVALAGAVAVSGAVALAGAVAPIIFCLYISRRALQGDPRDAWIRVAAISFAAIGGTSFRGANLTDADFTDATLTSTDFRKANLTRTCWKDAIKLDRVRPGESYLSQPPIRELVRTGNGENQNYDRLNLQGVNLQEAHLKNASFIETNLNDANLQDADLTEAQLFHIQLDGADLTGATLTGIFFKDYLITHKTKLKDIQCDYVYLEPGKQERRPETETDRFEPGDFAVLFAKEAFDTVDLIFRDGIDWKSFYESFIEVTNENNQAISIQSLEKKKNGSFVIRLNVPEPADTIQIEKCLYKKYIRNLKELEERYQERLQAKDDQLVIYQEHNKNMMGILKFLAEKDTLVQNKIINKPERHVEMNEGKRTIATNSYHEDNRDMSGNKGTIIENVGRDFNQYTSEQKQDLATAAAEIQKLLEELEKTYPTDTTTGKMTVATKAIEKIENDRTMMRRILSALKSGGTAALEELLSHPAASFAIAALEDWQKSKKD